MSGDADAAPDPAKTIAVDMVKPRTTRAGIERSLLNNFNPQVKSASDESGPRKKLVLAAS